MNGEIPRDLVGVLEPSGVSQRKLIIDGDDNGMGSMNQTCITADLFKMVGLVGRLTRDEKKAG